ncbi:MAG: hypothetical protein JW929_13225 [Anaerolineales bacterium]|nr:hypothetical protein [Anaerolineales bacterium]
MRSGKHAFHGSPCHSAKGRGGEESSAAPIFSHDLKFDQVVDAVTAGYREYDLKPFF